MPFMLLTKAQLDGHAGAEGAQVPPPPALPLNQTPTLLPENKQE
jgi:hypothetical protein